MEYYNYMYIDIYEYTSVYILSRILTYGKWLEIGHFVLGKDYFSLQSVCIYIYQYMFINDIYVNVTFQLQNTHVYDGIILKVFVLIY